MRRRLKRLVIAVPDTVSYDGSDEVDMNGGPGSSGWNAITGACIPADSRCGYTIAKFFYIGRPDRYGRPDYPIDGTVIHQGFGKGVLFWESDAQAAKFLTYSDTLSADSYWMTDTDLALPSQGGCALLPYSRTACGGGKGLTDAERALPANYAYDVTRLEYLQSLNGSPKPIVVDVETGCPGRNGICTTPAEMKAAAWHALIAGARGIIWFQHNFSGPCVDFNTFYDGMNPETPYYNCQQTPGVTLHDVDLAVRSFDDTVKRLDGVLLSPTAHGYVTTGKADVSTMAKYAAGKFYVFAGSGKPATPPPMDMLVTFTLAGAYSGPVTVIGEHRTLHSVRGHFTDEFANANSVHIYEIG